MNETDPRYEIAMEVMEISGHPVEWFKENEADLYKAASIYSLLTEDYDGAATLLAAVDFICGGKKEDFSQKYNRIMEGFTPSDARNLPDEEEERFFDLLMETGCFKERE